MKFGKEFGIHLEETLPDWRDKFLCYKPLKKLLKSIPQHPPADVDGAVSARVDSGDGAGTAGGVNVDVEECFVRILDEQLDKFNDFYVDKEEEFVIRLQVSDLKTFMEELKERIEKVRAMSSKSEAISSESEFSDEMLEIRKAFVTIHGEMVLLKNYSSLNFAGLVKILKKYDKRTGGLLRLPFTQRALHQPFFTTEPLTRLVRECEANLELLFPLEAEVIESGAQQETGTSSNPKISESSSLDVYRSTLAAMRAIQGLRKASSTYNPLSLGQFFQGVDGEDVAGAVTSENSGSNSPASSQNEEANQHCAQSGNQEHENSATSSKET